MYVKGAVVGVVALAGGVVAGVVAFTDDDEPVRPPRSVRISSYDVGPGGRTLEVTYGTGCFQTYDLVVDNEPTSVDIRMVTTYLPNPDGIACAAVVRSHTETVTLPTPLAERDVLSLGQPVPRSTAH